VLEFDADGEMEGRIVARKVVARDPVDAVYGTLRLDESTDGFVRRLRGEAEAT